MTTSDSPTTDTAKCPHHHRWGSYEPFGPDVCQACGAVIETEMSRHPLEEKNDAS